MTSNLAYSGARTIIETARELFDTDVNGEITNLPDVHPEYVRAVVELSARLLLDSEYDRVAAILGLHYDKPGPVTLPDTADEDADAIAARIRHIKESRA